MTASAPHHLHPREVLGTPHAHPLFSRARPWHYPPMPRFDPPPSALRATPRTPRALFALVAALCARGAPASGRLALAIPAGALAVAAACFPFGAMRRGAMPCHAELMSRTKNS